MTKTIKKTKIIVMTVRKQGVLKVVTVPKNSNIEIGDPVILVRVRSGIWEETEKEEGIDD